MATFTVKVLLLAIFFSVLTSSFKIRQYAKNDYLNYLCSKSQSSMFMAASDDESDTFHKPVPVATHTYRNFVTTAKVGLFTLSLPYLATAAETLADQTSRSTELEDDKSIEKSVFNIPPNPIEYPSSFSGEWDIDLKFEDTVFTEQIRYSEIARDVNVAGFRKYSIGLFPDIGKDLRTKLRFIPGNLH